MELSSLSLPNKKQKTQPADEHAGLSVGLAPYANSSHSFSQNFGILIRVWVE